MELLSSMSILASAAEVLRCFSGSRHDVTVSDLGILLGMPKSNASRLLRSMRDAGLLETVSDSKRYRPSALLLQAGQAFRSSSTLIERADSAVAQVVGEVGHTGYVSLRQGSEILGVTVHTGHQALRVVTNIGDRIPAFAASSGRALLARLPDHAVAEIHAGQLAVPSPTAPQTLDELLGRLAVIRAQGYAASEDEAVRGVGAISVAVGDPAQGEEVALCISYPVGTIPAEERAAIIRSLGEGAAAIAAVTGDPLFTPVRISSEQFS